MGLGSVRKTVLVTLTTSVLGARRLVDHARLRNCRHASTSEVYRDGDPLEHPQAETYWGNVNPIGERACYDEGKRAAETILLGFEPKTPIDAGLKRTYDDLQMRLTAQAVPS